MRRAIEIGTVNCRDPRLCLMGSVIVLEGAVLAEQKNRGRKM